MTDLMVYESTVISPAQFDQSIEYGQANAASAWQRITEVGMVRKGAALGQATAIHEKRRSLPDLVP